MVPPATYTGGFITHNDGTTISTDRYDFTLVIDQEIPFTLGGGMADGATTSENPPVMDGTGTPGARIEVQGNWGALLGRTIVSEGGTWKVTWCRTVVNGTYKHVKVIHNDGRGQPQVIMSNFVLNDPTGGEDGDSPTCRR